MLRRIGLLATALVAVVAAGCTATAPTPTPAPAPTSEALKPPVAGWQQVPLPVPGARVLAIAQDGPAVLVTGSVPGPYGHAPAAWTTTDARTWTPVPLTEQSAYAPQAQLIRVGVANGQVTALGEAFGGAHSNPRLTVWAGTSGALGEHEQPFEMFGGPHAIATNDVAAIGGTALLVGQWDAANGRYGAAVWTSADGAAWHRQADDPQLASADGEITSALGSTAGPQGFLVAGDTLHGATLAPLAWSSPDGLTWRRVGLSAPASPGGATADRAACDATSCVLLGATVGPSWQTLCWPSTGPADAFGAPTPGPSGTTVGVEDAYLDATGVLATVTIDGSAHVVTFHRDCSAASELPVPVDAPDAAIGALGSDVLLATSDLDHSRLWLRAR